MAFLGLDLPAGAQLVNTEKYGDWYRDPWGWPECTPAFAENLTVGDLAIGKLEKKYHLLRGPVFHVFDVPKSYIGVRPAVIQDPASRLAYAAAALAVAKRSESMLPE